MTPFSLTSKGCIINIIFACIYNYGRHLTCRQKRSGLPSTWLRHLAKNLALNIETSPIGPYFKAKYHLLPVGFSPLFITISQTFFFSNETNSFLKATCQSGSAKVSLAFLVYFGELLQKILYQLLFLLLQLLLFSQIRT